jgi:hypothetical protein
MRLRCCLCAALIALLVATDLTAATPELTIIPSSSAAASRIRGIALDRLGTDLERAGLTLPPRIVVTLIEAADPRARDVPAWIVGFAVEPDQVVIFPGRILSYPYDSIESVFRHEVAHLALSARAGGRTIPRWFHEGLAMSVDAGWGVTDRLRLLLETTGSPGTADLARLFASDTQAASALAYGLSAALVADIQRRHGPATPGAIAARMADGVPFARAFQLETAMSPDEAASRAWARYRHWTTWLSVATSEAAVWGLILAIALVAFVATWRRRARRRQQWDAEEAGDLMNESSNR